MGINKLNDLLQRQEIIENKTTDEGEYSNRKEHCTHALLWRRGRGGYGEVWGRETGRGGKEHAGIGARPSNEMNGEGATHKSCAR